MSSLNSFSLDDGPLVELQEGEGSDGENASEKSGGEYRGPKVKGVRHAGVSLDPVGWKRDSFKDDILGMLRKLVSVGSRKEVCGELATDARLNLGSSAFPCGRPRPSGREISTCSRFPVH